MPVVSDHLLCLACGYDLHGLDADGRCPECGAPVAASLSADLLHADPDYVGTLARGARLGMVGIVVRGFALTAMFLGSVTEVAPLFYGAVALLLVGLGASWFGWWCLSARRAGDIDARGVRSSLFLRVTIGLEIGIVACVVLWMLASTFAPMMALAPVSGLFTPVLPMAGIVVLTVSQVVACRRLAVLALLARSPDTARLFRQLSWLSPTVGVLGCALLGLGPLMSALMMLDGLDRLQALLTQVRLTRARLDAEK